MLNPGSKVNFFGNEAVILVCFEDEVLIFIDHHTIKWVDRNALESVQPS